MIEDKNAISHAGEPKKTDDFIKWLFSMFYYRYKIKIHETDDFYNEVYEKIEQFEQKDTIGEQIKELLNTINDAEKIDCTCDKNHIRQGRRCGCARGIAIQQAGTELGTYLRKLRKELKK